MWKQLIDNTSAQNWAETSSTAMFTFAIVTGVKNGWLPAATYGPAARKAWLALIGYINTNGDVREVCAGTGEAATSGGGTTRPRRTRTTSRVRASWATSTARRRSLWSRFGAMR